MAGRAHEGSAVVRAIDDCYYNYGTTPLGYDFNTKIFVEKPYALSALA